MNGEITFVYAGFWKRFIASIIDGFVLDAVGFFCSVAIAFILPLQEEWLSYFWAILSILIVWFYYALLESSVLQATLGKAAMGIMVTDLAGNRLSFGKATVRYFSKIISALLFLVGFFMIVFTPKKQGLHDILAGAFVVCGKRGVKDIPNNSTFNSPVS